MREEEEEEEEEVEEASSPGAPFVGWRRRRRRASSFCYSPEVGGWVGCPHALPPPKHGFGSDASKFSPGLQYSGLNPDSSPPPFDLPPSANSTVPEFVRSRCPEFHAVDSKRFVLGEDAKREKVAEFYAVFLRDSHSFFKESPPGIRDTKPGG